MDKEEEGSELKNCSVFFGDAFPLGKKIEIKDKNHFLSARNLVYDQTTQRFVEIRCFQRRGVFFFGQRVINSSLMSDEDNKMFCITEVNPFFILLPYLWNDKTSVATTSHRRKRRASTR